MTDSNETVLNTASSREAILGRIRAEQPVGNPPPRPPIPQVWPQTNPSTEQLVEQFTDALQAVDGEVIRCDSPENAKQALAELVKREGWKLIGTVDEPSCREATSALPPDAVTLVDETLEPRQMALFSAGVIASKYLLADTGSCMIVCPTAEQRLMCYLPPACVIIAQDDQLVENMPSVWEQVVTSSSAKDIGGEYVLITGPSRTADIEKILILGVHGPKRVIVLLVGG